MKKKYTQQEVDLMLANKSRESYEQGVINGREQYKKLVYKGLWGLGREAGYDHSKQYPEMTMGMIFGMKKAIWIIHGAIRAKE